MLRLIHADPDPVTLQEKHMFLLPLEGLKTGKYEPSWDLLKKIREIDLRENPPDELTPFVSRSGGSLSRERNSEQSTCTV